MPSDPKKLKEQVRNVLALIPTMDDAKRLKNLHANIDRNPDLEDADREELNEAVMMRLRQVSPSLATRLGGPKDQPGRDFLQGLLDELSEDLDLSGNTIGAGVKTGGGMLSGTKFVDVYISYKSIDGKSISMAWIKDAVDSQPYLHLWRRNMGGSGPTEYLRNEKIRNEAAGAEAYREELEKILAEA